MSYRDDPSKKRTVWYVIGAATGAALLAFIKSQTG